MSADLTLYIDTARKLLAQNQFTLQPLVSLDVIQAEEINVVAQFLDVTGNGLSPYVNIDPTGWELQFGIGYIDSTGIKRLISLATTTALTAISGITANTALTFTLNLSTTAAATLLGSVHSSPIWAEASWIPSAQSAQTGYASKLQIPGTIRTAYLGIGLPSP